MIGVICTGCGETVSEYHMCDKEMDDELWCDICFTQRPCLKEHEEGCSTSVFCGEK